MPSRLTGYQDLGVSTEFVFYRQTSDFMCTYGCVCVCVCLSDFVRSVSGYATSVGETVKSTVQDNVR